MSLSSNVVLTGEKITEIKIKLDYLNKVLCNISQPMYYY